jgi:hypothetical protein
VEFGTCDAAGRFRTQCAQCRIGSEISLLTELRAPPLADCERESPTAKGCIPSNAVFVGPMDIKKRLAREVQDGCPAGRKG